MRISIFGSGYVGLVAGVCYAHTGNTVTMVDVDDRRIEALRRGESPIYEPGLTELLQETIESGLITFTTDGPTACRDADMIGIAVGTPPRADGRADLSFVHQVAETIGQNINGYTVVTMKSTVPVGTHRKVTEIIRQNTDQEFDYVSNPEFLKEGSAVDDFLFPERVIVGATSPRAQQLMEHLYSPFMRQGRRILVMDPPSAELTKYACNSMLAVRISFMNEIARLAEAVGADIHQVRMGMGSDSRIGKAFLFPGLGYGGSCFPKDVKALIQTAGEHGQTANMVQAAHDVNDAQPEVLFGKIKSFFGGDLSGKRLAMWGLAFKPNTDDMREAKSLVLIEKLKAEGATVCAYDPKAMDATADILGDDIDYAEQPYDCLEGADGLIICTEWMIFRTPDFGRIRETLASPVIFDGRNLYEPQFVRQMGLNYFCIGRPDVKL